MSDTAVKLFEVNALPDKKARLQWADRMERLAELRAKYGVEQGSATPPAFKSRPTQDAPEK